MHRFNRRVFLWFVILFSFSLLLDYLLFTGKIYIFIHPKMVKYAIFSLIGFKILSIFELTQVFRVSRNNKIKPGYLLFLLPLILGFTAKGFDSSIVDKKNIALASSDTNTNKT